MQSSGEESSEGRVMAKKFFEDNQKEMIEEIEETHSVLEPEVAIESQLKSVRKRCNSVELVYSDDEVSTATSTISLVTSPKPATVKKGTCIVQTRCTSYEKLCLCEVKRHRSATSCWLVANGIVYDVTDIMNQHPAGTKCILRKAGGEDCTKDMKFHSKAARNCWSKCQIGKLQPCGEDNDTGTSCLIM
ncbi:hypothetical protein THRCLA_01269 [Thraustotheca clavata]|uniref:Cytochrome b5 heme-binding domain-containing protein n=1 Tax=Thraustotheca clavata TaxID=74557 RepID=A0A1W0A8S0_9STRA|nr:hypothetical protein THRCLA_01269 [Thraustotheca clavata]